MAIISYEDLSLIPTPASTPSYSPIGFKYFVDLIQHRAEREGWSVDAMHLQTSGVSKETGIAQELYGTIILDGGDGESAPQLAFRSSLNHHYAAAVCGGHYTFVCSNGQFDGDYMLVMRKQTTHAMRDIGQLVTRGVSFLQESYDSSRRYCDLLRSVELSLDEGYEMIGRALGHKVITSTIANVAFGDWRTPRHEEFSDRTGYSLYQCFTEAAKNTRAGNMLDAHTKGDAVCKEAGPNNQNSVVYDFAPF